MEEFTDNQVLHEPRSEPARVSHKSLLAWPSAIKVVFHTGFLIGACCILSAAAVGKIMTLSKGERILELVDPVVPLFTRGQTMGIASALELGCLVLILLTVGAKPEIPVKTVLWISSLFLAYRFGLWATAPGQVPPCPCLGSIGDALGLTDMEIELVTRACLVYLLVGSVGILALERFTSRMRPGRPGLKT